MWKLRCWPSPRHLNLQSCRVSKVVEKSESNGGSKTERWEESKKQTLLSIGWTKTSTYSVSLRRLKHILMCFDFERLIWHTGEVYSSPQFSQHFISFTILEASDFRPSSLTLIQSSYLSLFILITQAIYSTVSQVRHPSLEAGILCDVYNMTLIIYYLFLRYPQVLNTQRTVVKHLQCHKDPIRMAPIVVIFLAFVTEVAKAANTGMCEFHTSDSLLAETSA